MVNITENVIRLYDCIFCERSCCYGDREGDASQGEVAVTCTPLPLSQFFVLRLSGEVGAASCDFPMAENEETVTTMSETDRKILIKYMTSLFQYANFYNTNFFFLFL